MVARTIRRLRASGEILFSDTTLRDGEQMPGVAFSIAERTEIARALEKAGVHSIDAGFAAAGPEEVRAIEAVAGVVGRPLVMSLARTMRTDIDSAAEALASRPRHKRGIALFIATSPIHRAKKLGLDQSGVLGAIGRAVEYATRYFDLISFGAEDASRTEPEFLCECFRVAIDTGATSVGIADTVGILLPAAAAAIVRQVQSGVPNLDRALLAVHFHDDLGLAAANTLAAVEAGANIVQCTVCGLGERAGNAALEELALTLKLHGGHFGRRSSIDTTALGGLCSLVSKLSRISLPPHKAIVGTNVFATEAGVHQDGLLKDATTYLPFPPELVGVRPGYRFVIGKHSGRSGLISRLAALGIALDGAQLDALLGRIKTMQCPADADGDAVLRRMAVEAQSAAGDPPECHVTAALASCLAAVVEVVARLREEPVERLAARLDADLVGELELDSIQLLELWVDLEKRFGIPEGELGVSQAATPRTIAAELARLLGKGEPLLGQSEIEDLIPHRPPIRMLDRVIALVPGKHGIGERVLRAEDQCFSGHFPGHPILPGAFIVEACGQLLAVVCRAASVRSAWCDSPPVDYLAAIEQFKFLSPVGPGEVLKIEANVARRVGSLLQARVSASVAGRPVAEGVLNVTARCDARRRPQ